VSLQPFGTSDDIALFKAHGSSELLESREVEIDGPLTYRATPGHRHACLTESRQEWPKRKHRRAHSLDQFVWRFEEFDFGRRDLQGTQLGHEHL
jgi:hypothetical protein